MTFRIVADATFEADDIDDAFVKLRDHFSALADDGIGHLCEPYVPSLFDSGSITVEKEPTDVSAA